MQKDKEKKKNVLKEDKILLKKKYFGKAYILIAFKIS